MQLSLDHLTVVDTIPSRLAELAAATGCSGICPFLHSMEVLPAMPQYDLMSDAAEQRATVRALAAGGVTVDLVYPFTMTGRTEVAHFEPALAVAAELGAPLANILCYDRDPARALDRLAELAVLASGYGIGLAVEFYPPSQVRTLAEALAILDALDCADACVTLDLLHIMRGGDARGSMDLLSDPRIRMVQLSDGPAAMALDRLEWEASRDRLLPGEGVFDIPTLLSAIQRGAKFSVEVPQQSALEAGVSPLERARRASGAAQSRLAMLHNR